MKRLSGRNTILLLPPALLFGMAVWFRLLSGPFWQAENSDPDYAYLLNALNLLRGNQIAHVDHPGTPIQVIGAALIGLRGLFSEDVARDVLLNPERYLWAIGGLLVLGVSVALWLFGQALYRALKSLTPAVAAQMYFVVCASILPGYIYRATPEPALAAISLGLCALIVASLKSVPGRPQTALCGFGAGLGIACKLTFSPVAAAIFITGAGICQRGLFLAGAAVGLLVGTLPIVGQYRQVTTWIWKLTTHAGRYGSGPELIVDRAQWEMALCQLLKSMPHLGVAAALGAAAAVSLVVRRQRTTRVRVILGLLGMVFAQVVIVAKHPGTHYLLPALPPAAALIALAWQEARTAATGLKWSKAAAAVVLIPVGLLFAAQTLSLVTRAGALSARKQSAIVMQTRLDQLQKGCRIIKYYRASSQEYALSFGDQFAGNKYREQLRSIYPASYVYDIWSKDLNQWGAGAAIEQLLAESQCVAIQGTAETYAMVNLGANIEAANVFEGPYETVQRLTLRQGSNQSCFFGLADGWYTREAFSKDWLVWTGRRGEIEVVAPSAGQAVLKAQLESMPLPNVVRLALNGVRINMRNFPEQSNKPLDLTLPLRAGKNILEFVSDKPGIKPPTDSRALALQLKNVTISLHGHECQLN